MTATHFLQNDGRVHRFLRAGTGRFLFPLVVLPGIAVLAIAVFGPWLAPHALGTTVAAPFQPPGDGYLFGTDRLGRDLWSQILYGGRGMLVVPFAATIATVVVGATTGVTIGYSRGHFETVALAVLDLLLVLPPVLVMLVLATGSYATFRSRCPLAHAWGS